MPRVMEIDTPLGPDVLLFHGMHAREELSRVGAYQLRLLSLKDGIDGDLDRYVASNRIAEECRIRLDDLWGDIDVLLTPAAFGEAPRGDFAFDGVPMFQLWTILHVPAITLPLFKGPAGLPIGAQLLARRHDDRNLFACAQWVYQKLM